MHFITLSPTSPLMILAFALSTLAGDGPMKPSDKSTKSTDLKPLFDGKSLEGWKPNERTGEGKVEVVDGAMILDAGSPMAGITCVSSNVPSVDYELSFESKRIEGNDFFSAATFPINKSHLTLVNGGWGGSVTGLSMINGESAAENRTNTFVKYENGRWYYFKVQVTAKAIRCLVDEKPIFTIDHRGEKMTTRLETRVNQPLGFATYRTRGAIRAIKTRKLEPAEIASIEKSIPAED